MIEAELADGTVLEFPDGTDDAVVAATVKKHVNGSRRSLLGRTADDLGATARQVMTYGLADEAAGLGRAAGSLLKGEGLTAAGEAYNRGKGDEKSASDRGLSDNPVLGPTAWVLGALAGGAPAAGFKGATSLAGQMAQGAKIGAGAGAVSGFGEAEGGLGDRAISAAGGGAVGGLLGGLMPAAMAGGAKAYQVGKNILEPWLDPAAVKGRALLSATGDKTEAIIAALRGSKAGDLYTAGQAAASQNVPTFSALQRSAANAAPNEYAARAAAQGEMREGLLRQFAGDADSLAEAVRRRSAAADPLYDAARGANPPPPAGSFNPMGLEARGGVPGAVNTGGIAAAIDDVLYNNPANDKLRTVLGKIREVVGPGGRTDPRAVASTLDVLDPAMNAAARDGDKYVMGRLAEIKKVITDAIPGFAEAEAMYAKMSPPVGQQRVGQELLATLAGTADDPARQQAAAFLRARRDLPEIVQDATGMRDLTKVMEPRQIDNINKVAEHLLTVGRDEKLATKGAKAGANVIDLATRSMEEATGGKLPNILNRAAMVTNAIISRAEGKMNKKLATELAREMLDPQLTAAGMTSAWQKKKAADLVAEQVMAQQRYRLPSAVAGRIGGKIGAEAE